MRFENKVAIVTGGATSTSGGLEAASCGLALSPSPCRSGMMTRTPRAVKIAAWSQCTQFMVAVNK